MYIRHDCADRLLHQDSADHADKSAFDIHGINMKAIPERLSKRHFSSAPYMADQYHIDRGKTEGSMIGRVTLNTAISKGYVFLRMYSPVFIPSKCSGNFTPSH
jgi:hypothetical protein